MSRKKASLKTKRCLYRIKFIVILLTLLTLAACEGEKDANEPVAQIHLYGSRHPSGEYLFKIYPDKKVEIILANYIEFHKKIRSFYANNIAEQMEVSLTKEQYDELLISLDNFINEDWDSIEDYQIVHPPHFFNVIAIHGKKVRDSNGEDGHRVVSFDEGGRPMQTEIYQDLMLILEDICPEPIVYVRASY